MELVNALDVPDVFATTTRIEDAGGGCIRIYNCIVKDGMLVAVGNAVIFPVACIVGLADTAQEFARRLAIVSIHGAPIH